MAIAERPVRRLITVDGADGSSFALSDGPVDDVLRDPARPGFSLARVWATDRTPALALAAGQVHAMARSLGAPAGGSVFRILVLPPDASWRDRVGPEDVQAFFRAAGSPHAWCGPGAAHPYMQRTGTLDLCVVLEGTPTLVLDDAQVTLAPTDTVVHRGGRHAWANGSRTPCVIAISSHDGTAAARA
jgi:hypothetical protein